MKAAWSTIITLQWKAGAPFNVTLELGVPFEHPKGSWCCPVAARGLHENLADIHGVDSFQAGVLALQLLRMLVSAELDAGAELSWEGEPTTLTDLFGR
jgi:hypothetical protein